MQKSETSMVLIILTVALENFSTQQVIIWILQYLTVNTLVKETMNIELQYSSRMLNFDTTKT